MKKRLIALAVLGSVLAFAVSTLLPSPLPMPRPYEGELPRASPPASMQVFQLPTGATHRSAAFAYRGGAFGDARDFAMTAVLVRHPSGDVLIDTGFGREVERHLAQMPLPFRLVTSLTRGRSVAEQLPDAGLSAVLLTHAHWDHVSGLGELPRVPVLVTAPERRFIDEGGFLSVTARESGAAWQVYGFDAGAYLGFEESFDLYGDGSIVVVPCPGHTPGSVIVFLALPDGRRYALIGDLVWQREGITEREERPWIPRTFGDSDQAAVRAGISHVAALAARFPELVIVPAHEARAYETMPRP